MRMMTRKQGFLMSRLVKLAGGNTVLVDEAIRYHSREGHRPSLEDVTRYILTHKNKTPRGAARRREQDSRQAAGTR